MPGCNTASDDDTLSLCPFTLAPEAGVRDSVFLTELRAAVDRYLESIDAWEQAHAKYYRLVVAGQVSADMKPFQESYVAARRELEALVPQATRLCRKYGLREPWPSILRVQLGAAPPQGSTYTSALSRGERALVTNCLLDLEARIVEAEHSGEPGAETHVAKQPEKQGLLSRILDWFV